MRHDAGVTGRWGTACVTYNDAIYFGGGKEVTWLGQYKMTDEVRSYGAVLRVLLPDYLQTCTTVHIQFAVRVNHTGAFKLTIGHKSKMHHTC